MSGSIYDWSKTAADNDDADGDIAWSDSMNPKQVDNSGRQMMGRVAEILSDLGGTVTTSGSANAQTVTVNSGFAAYKTGLLVAFKAGYTNTGATTLSVNSIGAKAVRKDGDVALVGGEIKENGVYLVVYNAAANSAAGAWMLLNHSGFLSRDGTSSMTGDLPMGGYKITGMEDGAASSDAATLGQAQAVMPLGAILDFAGSTAPSGWLLCYGQAISRTTYAALFAIVGTTFGAGDGSTTFNLPDCRGRVAAGKDNMGGTSADRLTGPTLNGDVLGQTGGSQEHVLTTAQLPAHAHGAGSLSADSAGAHFHTSAGGGTFVTGASGTLPGGTAPNQWKTDSTTNSAGAHTHDISGNTANQGSNSAHNNVQPTIILNKIIKAAG